MVRSLAMPRYVLPSEQQHLKLVAADTQPITALSVRHQRPFRAVSGSDDNSIVLHTAVPFKYDKIISTHTRFVRDVQYAPDGSVFASVGSDGKLFIYDGKDGTVLKDADGTDGRSLMALSWAPDSTRLVTAGADGVVALWDAAAAQKSTQWAVGDAVEDQQNGVVWADPNTVVSASCNGVLNVFDVREGGSWKKLYGPTRAVTASALSEKTFYTGSFDGGLKAFSDAGACENVEGQGHSGQIVGLAPDGKGTVYSAAWDDKIAAIKGAEFATTSVPAKAQPGGIAATPNGAYVISDAGLELVSGGSSSTLLSDAGSAVAAHSGSEDLVAVGSGKKVTIYTVSGGKATERASFEDNKGEISALAFSADGSLLAAGDIQGRIVLIDAKSDKVLVSSRWTFHTGRVASLAFNAANKLVSGGADESIYIWNPEKGIRNIAIKNAHPGGVAGVSWRSDNEVISSGADACVRTWTIEAAA